jgi:hypothetical protein
MCVYDFQKSNNRWKEFALASGEVKPRLATTFDMPFLDSYGIGPSCLGVVQRMWKTPVFEVDSEDAPVVKRKHKLKDSGPEPVVSDYLLMRFTSSGGDWGYNFRSLLLDQLPRAAVIADFHAEITGEAEIEDMVRHTKVLVVLLSSDVSSPMLEFAIAHAVHANVKIAVMQHVREYVDVEVAGIKFAKDRFGSAHFFPIVRDHTKAVEILTTFTRSGELTLRQVQHLVAPLAKEATTAPGQVLSALGNALVTASGPMYAQAVGDVLPSVLKACLDLANFSARDGTPSAEQLIRVLHRVIEHGVDVAHVDTDASVRTSVRKLRIAHGLHPTLPKRFQALLRAFRVGDVDNDLEVQRKGQADHTQVFTECRGIQAQVENAAQLLEDLFAAGFTPHGDSKRRRSYAAAKHAEAKEQHDEGAKLYNEHRAQLESYAQVLSDMAAQIAQQIPAVAQRMADNEINIQRNIALLADLRKEVTALSSQKQNPQALTPLLLLFAHTLAGMDPTVDQLPTGAPRDTTWLSLRKMFSDPDRFIQSLKSIGKAEQPDGFVMPTVNRLKAREILEGEMPKSSAFNVPMMWSIIGSCLDMADLALEVRVYSYVNRFLKDAYEDVMDVLESM